MEITAKKTDNGFTNGGGGGWRSKASFMTWTARDVVYVARHHWIPCMFAAGLLFFMGVEYTLQMIPARSEPFDLGFVVTRSLNRVLASSPDLNTVLAALNTVCRASYFRLKLYLMIILKFILPPSPNILFFSMSFKSE